MKKLNLLFLLLPVFAGAQTAHSLLWKITKPGNSHTSYLFGSMHTNDSTLNTFSESWWNAFNSCHTLAGEINFTDQTELMSALQNSMMKDKTLQDLYTPDEFKRVQDFLMSRMEPMELLVVGRMKPFYIMATLLEEPKDEGPYNAVMDLRLQNLAVEQNKEVIGLESSDEQASAIEAMSIEDQAKMLLQFIDEGGKLLDSNEKSKEPNLDMALDELEKFYLEQNLDSLAAMMQQDEIPDEMMTSLLDVRNKRFVQNLQPHLEDTSVFCVVGAMHLPGSTGMIEMLKQLGYVLEPLKFTFTEAAKK